MYDEMILSLLRIVTEPIVPLETRYTDTNHYGLWKTVNLVTSSVINQKLTTKSADDTNHSTCLTIISSHTTDICANNNNASDHNTTNGDSMGSMSPIDHSYRNIFNWAAFVRKNKIHVML